VEMVEIVIELAAGHISYDELIDEVWRCDLIPEPRTKRTKQNYPF